MRRTQIDTDAEGREAFARGDAARHLAHTPGRAGLRNMQQLIQLRWIAVLGQLITILIVHAALDLVLPLRWMFCTLAALAVFNLGSQWWWRGRERVSESALLFALLVDVGSLALQLYFSGGITNPFVFLFLMQVALATVLLRARASWIVAAATTACVLGLIVLPAQVRIDMGRGVGLNDPYLFGLLICFVLVAALLVVFMTRIGRIVRARDARLAELRQRAAEEEHIVRMGLLASGAAHEIGTPLSTMAVILGDWQRISAVQHDVELARDVSEMQAQVARCKAIVTGILLVAGETRGEAPEQISLRAFLDGLASQWRDANSATGFDYRVRIDENVRIVSDTGLRQMVWNVLDNALEASPDHLMLDAYLREGDVVLEIADTGPGFDAGVLAQLGSPYNSTKGRPGGGLGLFLSANVARTLGGRLRVDNRPQGGAVVTISVPLASLLLEGPNHDR